MVILLILIGMPSQFGTMIGIVGAGLTVALKDFIVAFFGWLVLMGRNGIRLGRLGRDQRRERRGDRARHVPHGAAGDRQLERCGTSHRTARDVHQQLSPSKATTSIFRPPGQWLWDELQVVVPAGQDPYPIVDAITKQVVRGDGGERAPSGAGMAASGPIAARQDISGAPGIDVKPVVGGVEIAVRYLTRARRAIPAARPAVPVGGGPAGAEARRRSAA